MINCWWSCLSLPMLLVFSVMSPAITQSEFLIKKQSETIGTVAEIGEPGLLYEDTESHQEGGLYIEAEIQNPYGLVNFILQYDGVIPYTEGGRYWGRGFFASKTGIDNRLMEKKIGMDSLGYVCWVYHNLFGEVRNEIKDPVAAYQNGNRIKVEELKIGDIGMTGCETGKPNHFGIFIGYDSGRPVFTHCSSIPQPNYPGGVNGLSYLLSANNAYYNGIPPVDFRYFVRPQVIWKGAS